MVQFLSGSLYSEWVFRIETIIIVIICRYYWHACAEVCYISKKFFHCTEKILRILELMKNRNLYSPIFPGL